jgi:signal transduction histidine kinase
VTLQGDIVGEIGTVHMDARRIGRVLNNLVSNALRHTPPGGSVHLRASQSEGNFQVDVSDTGEGFDPDDLPHLFDRFYRGDKSRNRATGGVGLGLAIAKGFVKAHGGDIQARLLNEGGSCFTVTLPEKGPEALHQGM